MTQDTFVGSDESQSAGPLRHVQTVTFAGPLALENGETLPSVTVAYETFGCLNAARDNAVLICHALTGDSHVAAHDENDEPGWWDVLIGPGKDIDTDRYFVICPNVLGGCRGTTGPNCLDPATGKPYGATFPNITIGDMVSAQKQLVAHLGIETLLAVVGGSMGGHQALCWGVTHGESVRGVVALATSPRLSSQSLAFDIVGRNAIRHDPNFHEGQYYDKTSDAAGQGPTAGLALARMLGHITYLSSRAMSEKFAATRNAPRDIDTEFEKEFSVGSYLAYKGEQFTRRFDANSYVTLSMAMDQFDLGDTTEDLQATFAASPVRWVLASFSSDWLFPDWQSRQMVNALLQCEKRVSYAKIDSTCGHDAFLLEDDLPVYGGLTRALLETLVAEGEEEKKTSPASPIEPSDSPDDGDHQTTSLFHPDRRVDYDRIVERIPQDASVLDLGCGTGGLLARLKQRGQANIHGVDIQQKSILQCVRRGLDVVQSDLNKGLRWCRDDQFDFVVLSQALQAVIDVEDLLGEMLRVGKQCIVSVPNFAYHKLQDQFAATGQMPAASLLRHHWYDTPNLRFLTLKDFESFCEKKKVNIASCIALDTETGEEIIPAQNPNRNSDLAIYVLTK